LGKPTTVGAVGVFALAETGVFVGAGIGVFGTGVFGTGVFGTGVFGTGVFVGGGVGVSVRPAGTFGVSAVARGREPKTNAIIVRLTKR
jgi:hypothetical protein